MNNTQFKNKMSFYPSQVKNCITSLSVLKSSKLKGLVLTLVMLMVVTIASAGTISFSSNSSSVCSGTAGSSVAPSKTTGTVTISGNPSGVTVNSATGQISWTSSVAAGTYNMTVTLSSNGSANYTLTIKQGPTTGTLATPSAICTGNNTSLSLSGSSGNKQWQSSTDNVNFTDISGANDATYTTANLTDTMYYQVVVTNSSTGCSTPSNSVAVTVNANTAIVSQSSAAQTVCLNGTTSPYSISATGQNLTYKWYSNSSSSNSSGSIISGATSAAYSPSSTTAGTTYYYCKVSGTCGSTVSSAVSGAMVVNAASIAGTIATPTAICAGSTKSLSLSGNTGNIQWQSSADNINFNNIASATSSSYTTAVLSDTAYYQVVVTNGVCASATSAAVAVNVRSLPVINTQPSNVTMCAGTSNSITVGASGTGLNYQWKVSNNGGSSYSNATDNSFYSGSNTATLTFSSSVTTSYNTYKYQCVVSGTCSPSVTSNAVTLTVKSTSSSTTTVGICSTALPYSWNGNSYTATGSYVVHLTNAVGCDSAATLNLTVTNQPSAGVISGTSPLCSNGSATFTSNGTAGGVWTSGTLATATIGSSTGVISPVAAGTTVITYTVTGTGGCVNASATTTLTVTAAPNAGTLSGTQAICSNGSTTFTTNGTTGGSWTSGTTAVATINATSGLISPVAAGTSTITYTLTASGCTSTATRTVTVSALSNAGTIAGAATVCAGTNSTTLTLSGYVGTIQWVSSTNSGSGYANISSATNANCTENNLSATKYYKAVVTSGACAAATSAYSTITVNSLPLTPTVSVNQPACGVSNGTVSITSTTTGLTFSKDGTNYATYTGAFSIPSGTSYSIIAKNSNGCVSNARTGNINATIVPVPTISVTQPICGASTGSVAVTSSTSGLTFSTNGTNYASYTSPYTVNAGASYSISAMNGNGCFSAAASGTLNTTYTPANAGTISGAATLCSNGSTTYTTNGDAGGVWSSATTSVATIGSGTGVITSAGAGTSVIQYTVTGTGNCSNAIATKTISVVAAPTATAGNALVICANDLSANNITAGASTTNSTAVSWTVNGTGILANANSITTATYAHSIADTTTKTLTITLTATGAAPCAAATITKTISIPQQGVWSPSGADSSWSNINNWTCGIMPDSTKDVDIKSANHNPEIVDTQNCHHITIEDGVTLKVKGKLRISGNIYGNGHIDASEGELEFNGSAAQTIPAGCVVNRRLKHLTISNDQGFGLSDSLFLSGILSFGYKNNSKFHTNDKLVMLSDSTGTAALNDITNGNKNSGNSVDGKVLLQRYHFNKRTWMFLTTPLTTYGTSLNGDIKSNWQKYTYITGATTAGGLDQNTNTNSSIYTWLGNSGWTAVTNTIGNNTLIGNHGGDSADNKSYMIFLRGDRSITPAMGIAGSSAVTLMAEGAFQTGKKYFTLPTLTGTKYALIGNPYAAPIDLNKFAADNTGLFVNGTLTIYYWDPKNSGTGGYTTATYSAAAGWNFAGKNTSNAAPRFMQSGQAFFVSTNGQSNAVFNENQKDVTQSNNNTFGTATVGKLSLNLSKGSTFIDGVLGMFGNSFSTSLVTPGEDAGKFWGNEEGLGMLRAGKFLSIEGRPEIATDDTMYLYMNKMTVGTSYKFDINAQDLPTGIHAALVDKYLNQQTALDLTQNNSINFTIDTAAASKSATRFMIVFNNPTTMNVKGLAIRATAKNSAAIIDWKVVTETNVDRYDVEKSTDGENFVKIATKVANNKENSAYSITDNKTEKGNNFYRIKAINMDGNVQYSTIAMIIIGGNKSGISVYPNPIVGKEFNLSVSNMAAGNYAMSIINTAGQTVYNTTLQHAGGSATNSVHLPSMLNSGEYHLVITGNNNTYSQTVIIK